MTSYPGSELELFAHASNWKKYLASQIRPYLTGNVLEVGAGLGANFPYLDSDSVSSWTCLEPDPELFSQMRNRFIPSSAKRHFECGTIERLGSEPRFDAILYIDVLEHIENDREELARASRLLQRNGRIVVLVPAHQWLYTPFDRAIGHWRRYQRSTLTACSPKDCGLVQLRYMDSAGMLASIGNRLFLRQATPALKQILFWDRFLVRTSRLTDLLTFHRIGKSLLAIWEKL
jgi:SAM-dependent methyltransferase